MIELNKSLASLLRRVASKLIMHAEHFSKYRKDVLKKLYSHLSTILMGETSSLRSVLMFAMSTQIF